VVNPFLDAELVEQALGSRVAQRAHGCRRRALAVCQRLDALLAGAHDKLKFVDVVRLAEADLLLPVRRDFQAVHGEVEVTAIEAGDQRIEGVLLELDRSSQLFSQGVGQIDFEADVAFRIVGIFENVGGSAFRIGGPDERLGRVSDRREDSPDKPQAGYGEQPAVPRTGFFQLRVTTFTGEKSACGALLYTVYEECNRFFWRQRFEKHFQKSFAIPKSRVRILDALR